MQTNEDLTQKALRWLRDGIAVFPTKADKRPALSSWRWLQDKLPTERQVCTWMNGAPGYAVVAGWGGLVVVDFDDRERYAAWCSSQPLLSNQTYTVRTSRGTHVYLRVGEPVKTMHYDKVDVIARGGYVLGAGSIHPSGCVYTALDDAAPILQVNSLDEVGVLSGNTRQELHVPQVSHENGQQMPSITGQPDLRSWDERVAAAKKIPAWTVLGVTPQPSGAHHGMAHCPMHEDAHVSLSCDFATGRVSCLAGCTGQKGWDSIDAAQWRWHVGFRQAVTMLAERTVA